MFTTSQLLEMNLNTIQTQGYIYDLQKGGSAKFNPSNRRSPMPSRGSRLNCQAAADLLLDMCKADEEENGVKFNLVRVYYSNKNGFIVLGLPGLKAFGNNEPPHGNGPIKCWEFDNHYRVLDMETQQYYDPTFGTMGDNPEGIIGTLSDSTVTKDLTTMWTIYGEKYRVERNVGKMAPPNMVIDLNSSISLSDKYKVRNNSFAKG